MKKLMLSALLTSLLAACASTGTQQKAAVEEKPVAAAQSGAASQGATSQAVAVSPLDDPNNILYQKSVYFDFDSSAIKDQYKPLVEAHAKYLMDHSSARVQLQGNTDERGSAEYNLALGQRRADAVKKLMEVAGVSASQLSTVSFGKEKPKATCHDESCWKENRRVDIDYQSR